MKSQHRHELQTNELGKVADKVYGSVGTYFERHGNTFMIGLSIAFVAGAILIYKMKGDRARESAAWRDLASATKADDFADVWKTHPDTAAANWAHVHEGESRLSEGIQLLFSNVESATEELKKSREALQSVVDRKSVPAVIRDRALFGLARCLEALSDGNEAEALKTYEVLLREFPGSIYKKDAESRIAALKSSATQDFYAWFAKYPRPKASEKRPRDRGGDARFNDTGDLMNELPDGPMEEEDLSDLPAESEASAEASSEETTPPEPPAEETTPSAPAAPSDEKSSDEVPGEGKTADEEPAESDSPQP